MGVDVWGRGSYGGGGFGCYKAIQYISPDSLGLSVALFAQAWTWETEEDKPGFTWDKWWQYERDLWVGSPDPNAVMPVPKNTKAKSSDDDGPFKPFSAFFTRLPPPDPRDVPFHTSFCPGVGYSWYITGSPVSKFAGGWMDVDKQTTMGDLLWPLPEMKWDTDSEESLPNISVSVNMDDAWNSGSSIKLDFTGKEAGEDVPFRSFWVPIQTLSLTTQKSYTASIVYKVIKGTEVLDLDIALAIRPLYAKSAVHTDPGMQITVEPHSVKTTDISNSWVKTTIQFIITDTPPITVSLDTAIGLVITTVSNDTTVPFSLSLLLGQINVYPTPSPTIDPNTPRILWADYRLETVEITSSSKEPAPQSGSAHSAGEQNQDSGLTTKQFTNITWQPATSLQQVGPVTITSPDDPNCVWTPQPPLANEWFPGFLYFNIYAAAPGIPAQIQGQTPVQQAVMKLQEGEPEMTWLGTSGADGSIGKGKLEFTFDRTQLPAELRDLSKIRIFVQGLLDTGEFLDWERCAYVDVQY